MTDRIEKIRRMLRGEPEDVLLNFSLGMELASAGRHRQAVEAFQRCIELDGDYLPAYVETGKCLRAAGDFAAARETFTTAMRIAEQTNQQHTRDFIRQQLTALPKEM